eukprot:TRINITY_DN9780_c0_g1_i1.p1 TRINITY_DN9780_c0_g1~~TRINITY_DN9780_c0_g1_i1.p1  ORF type:complete len:150 (-),score=35.34 TRINITY_DN9780_c0_g1_i1:439-888(-)
MIGHFTALIWKGSKGVGCWENKRCGLLACRYANSPNMRGRYYANVPKRVRSFSQCKARIQQCGLPVTQFTGVSSVIGLADEEELEKAAEDKQINVEMTLANYAAGVVAFVALAAMMTFAARRGFSDKRQIPDDREMAMLEVDESPGQTE